MRKNTLKGFTLLETVIAAFVFVTTVVGVLSVWTAHSRGIAKARMVLVANELGEQIMEECVAARYQNVDQFHNDPLLPPSPPIEIDFVIKDRPISAKFYTIVTVTELEVDRIKEVKVQVQWTDSTNPHDGDRSSVNLITELHSSA